MIDTWYGCSPYAPRGGFSVATHETWAIGLARWIYQHGAVPVLPHLFFPRFLDDKNPEERAWGLQRGLEQLALCQRLIVLDIPLSQGMAAEVAHTAHRGIPLMKIPLQALNVARLPRPFAWTPQWSQWIAALSAGATWSDLAAENPQIPPEAWDTWAPWLSQQVIQTTAVMVP